MGKWATNSYLRIIQLHRCLSKSKQLRLITFGFTNLVVSFCIKAAKIFNFKISNKEFKIFLTVKNS